MTLTLALFISHFSDLLENTGFCFAVPEFLSLPLSLFFFFLEPFKSSARRYQGDFSQAKLILGAISIIRLAFPVIRCRPSDRTLDGGWVLEHTRPPLNLRKRAPSEQTKACKTTEEIVGKIG